MSATDKANTAGLEVIAWVIPGDPECGVKGWIDARAWQEGEFSKPLVTAASAEARIDQLLARIETARIARAEHNRQFEAMKDRAQAAEARADRLAKALGEAHGYLEVLHSATNNATTRSSVWKVIKRVRAALQQETQP